MSKLTGITAVDFGVPQLELNTNEIWYNNGTDTFELVRTDTTDALDTRVDNVYTQLLGTATNAVDLGTFTGTTILDNRDVKEALQDLETAVEANAAVDAAQARMHYVAISSASPAIVDIAASVPAGAWVTDVRLRVDVAWDGTAPVLSVGNATDGANHYAAAGVFDLKTASSAPQVSFILDQQTATEAITANITQDASTVGSGVVIITYVE